jgi:hypothetical protein
MSNFEKVALKALYQLSCVGSVMEYLWTNLVCLTANFVPETSPMVSTLEHPSNAKSVTDAKQLFNFRR